MQHTQTTNTTMLILLRISLMLVATLTALMLTIRYMDALPLGKTWLFLAALAGSLLIGSELLGLFRELASAAKPNPGKATRLPASQP